MDGRGRHGPKPAVAYVRMSTEPQTFSPENQLAFIRRFAEDLATITGTLRRKDGDLRTILSRTPGAARD